MRACVVCVLTTPSHCRRLEHKRSRAIPACACPRSGLPNGAHCCWVLVNLARVFLLPHENYTIFILQHPNYSGEISDPHDIGLLKLSRPAQLSSIVGLACLPKDPTTTFPVEDYTVSGWGRFDVFSRKGSDQLKATTLKEVPISDCARQYHNNAPIDHLKHMCAAKKQTDSCLGDSGGIRHFLL